MSPKPREGVPAGAENVIHRAVSGDSPTRDRNEVGDRSSPVGDAHHFAGGGSGHHPRGVLLEGSDAYRINVLHCSTLISWAAPGSDVLPGMSRGSLDDPVEPAVAPRVGSRRTCTPCSAAPIKFSAPTPSPERRHAGGSSSSSSISSWTAIPKAPTSGIWGLNSRARSTAPRYTATRRMPRRW
jgi:hypothetical protein